jgi:hypothetical protein
MNLLTSMQRSSLIAGASVVASILSVAGCARSDDGRMQVYPVTGKVTVGGQPAEGAELVFYGATPDLKGPGTIPPVGTTDANGEFALTSYEPDDGAPAGKFQVTVFWPEPIPEGADEEMFQPKDRLKEKYLDPETSQLSAEIPVGGAELAPFEL